MHILIHLYVGLGFTAYQNNKQTNKQQTEPKCILVGIKWGRLNL